MRYSRNSAAILGIGKVNLKSGRCKYFNIYETYDGTVEVWKAGPEGASTEVPGCGYKLVFTAGTSSRKPGQREQFHQDQTGRSLPSMTFVKAVPVKDMASLIEEFGNKLSGFTYK